MAKGINRILAKCTVELVFLVQRDKQYIEIVKEVIFIVEYDHWR